MPKTEIEIIRQQRKTMMMSVKPDGGVAVFIPSWLKKSDPQVKLFIKEGLAKLDSYIPPVAPTAYNDAKSVRRLVRLWAKRMDIDVGRITMRTMYRKWGSCSGRGNITLNTALYYVPQPLAEYVVVHELAHLKVFNHSPEFWALVGQYLADYAERERELDGYRV
ncbi:MAG: M48 family metallopeptidase [Chitinophagaceae bacterium]|nr:M48 family metallopeptidase [Anaerolineae bacterium]